MMSGWTGGRGGLVAFGLAVAALLVLEAFPAIDLAVSGWFAAPGGGFPLHELPLFRGVMKGLPWALIGAAVVVAVLGLAALATRGTFLGVTPNVAAYVVASLALGPGLIVNTVLKDHWGRARPVQIANFGGTAHFTPPLVLAHQCARNCSFPSGHAALGFWVIAFALLAPPRWRPLAVAAALLVGALVGLMRIAQGAHFLSDVLAAGILVVGLTVTLKRALADDAGRPPLD